MAITVERLKAEIEADPARAIAGLTAFDTALTAATRDRTIDIDIDKGRGFDDIFALGNGGTLSLITNGLNSIETAGAGAAKGLGAVADAGGGAAGGLSEVGQAASGAGRGMGSFGSAITSTGAAFFSIISTVVMFAGVLSVLPGALAMAGAAVGALAAALAPLVGLLGVVVPLLGALMMGIGAVAAVAMPVIGAFSALGAAEDAAGGAAEDTAAKHQALAAALHGVQMATESLADARKELAKAPHEAAEAIEDAHFAAAHAILAERRAVLALQDAQKNLSDMQNEIARSGLKVTQQTDEFTGKIYDVAVTSQDASVKASDLRDAQLDLAEAELAVAEARDHSGDTQMTLTELEKKGIKNSDIMVRARRRVRDAEYALKQAHQQVANAQKALNTQMAGGSTAAKNLADAMDKLTPAGQEFVHFLKDEVAPAFGDLSKAVQDGMIPGLQSGFESILDMMPLFEDGMKQAGKRVGTWFDKFFGYWAKPAQQERLDHLFDGMANVLGHVLKLAKPLSRIFVSIMDAARPLTNKILGALLTKLDELADWMETDEGKKSLLHFFNRAGYFLGLWMDVLTPLAGILDSVLKAAKPLAKDILKDLADHFGEIDENLKGDGFKGLKKWFNDQKPALEVFGDILGQIWDLIFDSTKGGKDSSFYKVLVAIRDDVLPPIQRLFKRLDDSDFASQLTTNLGSLITNLEDMDWSSIETAVIATGDAAAAMGDLVAWITQIPAGTLIALGSVFAGMVAFKTAGGLGGLGGGLFKNLFGGKGSTIANPMYVWVVNGGVGAPGGGPGGMPGGKWTKFFKRFGLPGAVLALGVVGVEEFQEFHRGGDNKPKNDLAYMGPGGFNKWLDEQDWYPWGDAGKKNVEDAGKAWDTTRLQAADYFQSIVNHQKGDPMPTLIGFIDDAETGWDDARTAAGDYFTDIINYGENGKILDGHIAKVDDLKTSWDDVRTSWADYYNNLITTPPPPTPSSPSNPEDEPTTSYGDDQRGGGNGGKGDGSGKRVTINNHYHEKIDPQHVAREQAWQLAGAGSR